MTGHKVKQDQDLLTTIGSWLIYVVMSTLGALANYAEKVDKGEKFSLKTLMLRWIVAAFASAMAALYAESQGWDKRFIFMICGVAGYMGVSAIKMCENLLRNRMGVPTPEVTTNENTNRPDDNQPKN